MLWRSMLKGLLIVLASVIYEQFTPSLSSFTFIDAKGHLISPDSIPKVIEKTSDIPLKNPDLPASSKPAYVLARVFLPDAETSTDFSSLHPYTFDNMSKP